MKQFEIGNALSPNTYEIGLRVVFRGRLTEFRLEEKGK
jgi:hypothetical protein